ncbi:MAG: sialate O-acetylesterase [Bacteroidales bacterium]|nr:sialate O-acetylesterase [Bacteroidales bacterium]
MICNKKYALTLLTLLAVLMPADARRKPKVEPKIKVSCVGNSITYGMRIENREQDSYPVQLQRMLGDRYEVGNFGKSGATLLRHGHRPYFEQEEFRQALDFAGDIVVIHLGINDTDPRNWPHFQDEFVGDYLALVDSLRSVNPKARFLIARMTPIGSTHPRFISGTKVWHGQIQEAIETVAHAAGADLIDFYEPLYRYPWMFPDAIHPNVEGADILAKTVYSGITGDYGGLQVSQMFSDHMVLPREKPFPIRGRANAGECVKVTVDGAVYQAIADNRGAWSVTIPAHPVETGAELRIETPGRSLVYTDIAFGDIWLCSGQSNMEFEVGQTTSASDVAADPDLRLYDMKCNWRTDNVEWPASALDSVTHLQYFKPARWTHATPETLRRFSAVGYYFGKVLRDSLQVPIGLINNAVGGSTAESWIDRETLETRYPAILRDWTRNDLIMEWARGRALKNIGARKALKEGEPCFGDSSRVYGNVYATDPCADHITRHPYEPCYLFEAGILPLDHYPITGVIWYQGESNADRVEVHEDLFPLLVDSWRNYFSDVPFYYVQLSSLNRTSWPIFRDSQRRLLESRPGLGMAVTSDLGDKTDVHYKNKKPVGERLALQALAKHYGHHVAADGPLAREAVLVDGKVLVDFGPQTGLHASDGGSIVGFEVLDAADGLYHSVEAQVLPGTSDMICLDASFLREPTLVRYAWQPYTRANLVNGTGLPASTFRLKLQ